MSRKMVEICCGSYEDCLAAECGGADRVELNSALFLGGLTPSIGTLQLVKRMISIPVVCMVRPRGAGFCYDDTETAVMFEDAEQLLKNGADGIAFGFLKEDRTIDRMKTEQMIHLIHSYQKEAVFHRAFDCVDDRDEAIMNLIEMKADRILTSGGQEKAIQAEDVLQHLQETYGERIELLAGSGVNADNASKLMHETGIHQVHSSAKVWKKDPTTTGPHVSYAYHEADDYDAVSRDLVAKLVQSIK